MSERLLVSMSILAALISTVVYIVVQLAPIFTKYQELIAVIK